MARVFLFLFFFFVNYVTPLCYARTSCAVSAAGTLPCMRAFLTHKDLEAHSLQSYFSLSVELRLDHVAQLTVEAGFACEVNDAVEFSCWESVERGLACSPGRGWRLRAGAVGPRGTTCPMLFLLLVQQSGRQWLLVSGCLVRRSYVGGSEECALWDEPCDAA